MRLSQYFTCRPLVIISLMTLATPLYASTVTIYKDFAVVQDKLELSLQTGVNDITHYDITRQLEPSSVILAPTDPDWRIIVGEQNYLGTPLDQARLLEQFEGEEIGFSVTFDDHSTIKKGTIIRAGKPAAAHTSAQSVIIEMDGQLSFGLPGTPLFPPLSDHRLLKPQLSWKLNSNKSGSTDANLSYLTQGFGWKAAYNFIQSSKTQLTGAGWLTIENQSGKDFNQTKLKLVAGNVNKISAQPLYRRNRNAVAMMAEADTGVSEKAVDEFHLYTVPGKLDLRSGETKQVQFLSGQNIGFQTEYLYDGAQLPYGYDSNYVRTQQDFGTQANSNVAIYKVVENTAKNGLGKPLPEGTIRFYEQDDDGALIFIGENRISHTPKEETVRVFTGNAFDLKGERKQTAYSTNKSSRTVNESIQITLKNRKPEAVTFTVKEHLYRGPNHEINSQDQWTKTDATTITQKVLVPANSEKKVSYSVVYRW